MLLGESGAVYEFIATDADDISASQVSVINLSPSVDLCSTVIIQLWRDNWNVSK